MKLIRQSQWKVKLSDGKEYVEGFAPFEEVAGEKSPWLKLRDYIIENKLSILDIGIMQGETIYRLNGLVNPKFSDFSDLPQAKGYRFFRKFGLTLNTRGHDYFAVIEATYEKYKMQLWVNEYTKDCWCVVK